MVPVGGRVPAATSHTSLQESRILDKMADSCNRFFTFKLILLLSQSPLIFPKTAAALAMRTLISFSQLPLYEI